MPRVHVKRCRRRQRQRQRQRRPNRPRRTLRELDRRLRALAWAVWESSTLLHFAENRDSLDARTMRAIAKGRPLPKGRRSTHL